MSASFLSAQLQYRRAQETPDTPDKRHEMEVAAAKARMALDIARLRASRTADVLSRSDVAKCEEVVRGIEGLQRALASEK